MMIPFLELRHAIAEMRPEFDAAYDRVLSSGTLILGPEVEAFEREFATACGAAHAVGVGCGLDALTLIMKGLELGSGDEVIVPSNTYIATWLAITAAGARVVPVEPDIHDYTVDPKLVEAAITDRTAAILPVHLYGQTADMDALAQIGARHGVPIIVDAAQAAGARYRGESGAALGHAAAFSFYPTKNVGGLGDGGAVVTNDVALAGRIRKLRNYGSAGNGQHEFRGVNSRLDELQAGFLRCRLKTMTEWNARRVALAERYLAKLEGLPLLGLPRTTPDAGHVWHLFTVQVADGRRDELKAFLRDAGIGTGIYYPIPPHRSAAYGGERWPALPVCEHLAASILSLPLHPHLTMDEVDQVCAAVARWHASL
jgi:dTDP-3-amino-3,4,6-trideoxy-alpha-D-glucose transaminase